MTKNVGRCQIVDGLKSIKMIRSFEDTHPGIGLSDCAACNGRVPVFAVSASLVEKDRQLYVDGSFDGWILKPIDFKRPGGNSKRRHSGVAVSTNMGHGNEAGGLCRINQIFPLL